MTRDWIITLSVLAGSMITAILTGLIRAIASTKKANIQDAGAFRLAILKRLESLETKTARLEEEVDKWRQRYWSLYLWMTDWGIKNHIDVPIPEFHDGKESTQNQQKETNHV